MLKAFRPVLKHRYRHSQRQEKNRSGKVTSSLRLGYLQIKKRFSCVQDAEFFQEKTIFINQFTIGPDLAPFFHVGDHVPMDCRLILPPGLQVRLTNSHMNGPPYFFIKENV